MRGANRTTAAQPSSQKKILPRLHDHSLFGKVVPSINDRLGDLFRGTIIDPGDPKTTAAGNSNSSLAICSPSSNYNVIVFYIIFKDTPVAEGTVFFPWMGTSGRSFYLFFSCLRAGLGVPDGAFSRYERACVGPCPPSRSTGEATPWYGLTHISANTASKATFKGMLGSG